MLQVSTGFGGGKAAHLHANKKTSILPCRGDTTRPVGISQGKKMEMSAFWMLFGTEDASREQSKDTRPPEPDVTWPEAASSFEIDAGH
jgi:hypothetical protein